MIYLAGVCSLESAQIGEVPVFRRRQTLPPSSDVSATKSRLRSSKYLLLFYFAQISIVSDVYDVSYYTPTPIVYLWCWLGNTKAKNCVNELNGYRMFSRST